MNRMGLSAPWDDSLEIIALYPVKNTRDEPNGTSCPLGKNLDMQGIKPMGLSAPWAYSLEIIALHTAKNTMDESNGPYWPLG